MSGCNSIECNSVELTYYQKKKKRLILIRTKYFHENDKKRLREQARDNLIGRRKNENR